MTDSRLSDLFMPPVVFTLSVALIGSAAVSGDVKPGVFGGMLYTFGWAYQAHIVRDKYGIE